MASYYNPSKWLSERAAAFLSPYIKLDEDDININDCEGAHNPPSSSLSVGLWSGNVELKNVELRPEALEQCLNHRENSSSDSTVQIKWKVIHGSIDSVNIKIPWKSLLVGASTSKYSVPENDGGKTSDEEGKTETPNKVVGDEQESSACAGCTTVNIHGVEILLGYDVVHHDPLLIALQSHNRQNTNKSQTTWESAHIKLPEDQLQDKIREEKNRILQNAERRLLAGLDPFPPSSTEGLQSILATSIQSGMQSCVKSDDIINTKNCASNNARDKPNTVLSRVENYLSSTIKSLLWRVFDSLSLSVTRVQFSVVGHSHYDKDVASRLRRERVKAGGSDEEKMSEQQQQQQEEQQQHHQQNIWQRRYARKRDYQQRRQPTLREDRHTNKASPLCGRRSTGSTMEEESVDENMNQNHGKGINEKPSIWSREGQIELGMTFDQFDIRPGPLSPPHDAGSSNSKDGDVAGSSSLKILRFRGVGVFLRRKHRTLSGVDDIWEAHAGADAEGVHTGKTLVWNEMNEDDYVVRPTNMEASCKVYRNISDSAISNTPSPKKNEGGLPDVRSKTSATVLTSGSKGIATRERRGKRDKRHKAVGALEVSSPPSEPVQSLSPQIQASPSSESLKQPRQSNATPSTSGTSRFTQSVGHRKGTIDDSPPHRLELNMEMERVWSSVSPRQIFLIHSLSSSMARLKRGRPLTTIRAAQASDKNLRQRMIEEGQSLIAWEDHIYRELPSLRPRYAHQQRSLPSVVSSWWKYAYVNVVNEIQEQKTLLAYCDGDKASSWIRKKGTVLSRSVDSFQRRWDWAKQSRIRKEYIDLYLLAHQVSTARQMPTSPTDEEAAVTAATFRLEQLEDELSVERILLLKHVARAASVRCADGDIGQTSEVPPPSDQYYCFPANYNPIETAGRSLNRQQQMKATGHVPTLLDKSSYLLSPTSGTSNKLADEGGIVQDSTVASGPRDLLSFSANFVISGFSLAVCDFCEDDSAKVDPGYGDMDQLYQPPDDISTVTGFWDDEDDDASEIYQKASGGDDSSFDPLCFWPATRHGLRCEPIMLMHFADIHYSAQSVRNDSLRKHVESDFSVGGIALQGGAIPSQKYMFCLGNIRSGDSTSSFYSTSLQSDAVNQLIGITGQYSPLLNNSIVSVGPLEVIADWDWLEQMLRFASVNKDVGPSRVTVPLEAEDLLVRAFSNQKNISANSVSITLEFDRMSLTIPVVQHTMANDEEERLLLVTTVNHLQVRRTCDPCESFYKGTTAGENVRPPSQDMLFNLDSFDTVILKDKSRTSTRLLHFPVSIRLRYSSVEGMCSLDQPQHVCQSYDATSSAIIVLLSEFRLRALIDMTETISNMFVKAGDASEEMEDPTINLPANVKPMPALAEYVFVEMTTSLQSLGIRIVPDGDENVFSECPTSSLLARDKLEYIIASFISQLSCLDFKHPNQDAIGCMTRLITDRFCALGMSKKGAEECTKAAKASFEKEVRRRKSDGHFADMNFPDLSAVLDQIAERATAMAMAEVGDIYIPNDFFCSKHELAIDAKSLEVSRSLFYRGDMFQINTKSLVIGSGQMSLLRIQPPQDVQASESQPSPEKKEKSSDEEVALTISCREHCGADLNRGYCKDIYFEAGNIDSVFSPEQYLEAMKAVRVCKEAISGTNTPNDQIDCPKMPTRDIIVNGSASSLSILLADKFLPFIECRFRDVAIEMSENQATTKASLNAGTLSIDCVCQSSYPNIISTYRSKDGQYFEQSSMKVQMTSHKGPASGPNETLINLDGVRIVLLRQVINEILQYTESPHYGIGLFLSGLESEKGSPDNAPSRLRVLVNNSTLILPRDSNSIDMVGIEAEQIAITCERAAETWSVDKYSFSDNASKGEQYTSSASSSDLFFDCTDCEATTQKNGAFREQQQVRRFTVNFRCAHIYTALNKHRFSAETVHLPELNAKIQNTGRAKHNKPPFTVSCYLNKSILEDVKSRVWEKVTVNPLNLEIKVDYAPTMRLLVEDIGVCDSRGVSFDMRMSQFYLLISIWFSNMNELPIMFPYDKDFVEKRSLDPDPPSDWPEYGTEEFVKRLKCGGIATATFEMGLCFKNLSWRCSYDSPNYFAKVPPSMDMMQSLGCDAESGGSSSISVSLGDVICSIMMDEDTLQRIAIGATSIKIHDGRHSTQSLGQGISAKDDHSLSFVDRNWGLDCGCHTLIDGLPLAFQLTVFLTPDKHCLINLGMDMAEATLVDLAPVWILLDYFGLYFKEPEYGHPAFEAERIFHVDRGDSLLETANGSDDDCLSIDFRLWMIEPHVIIPSSSETLEDICVMVEASGFYYRYNSFGLNYSSQDIMAKGLGLVVLREYMEPSESRGLRQVSGSLASCGIKTLVDGLSFSLRYCYNESTNFTRFALSMPLTSQHIDRHSMEGIESPNKMEAQPFSVPPPSVCKPFVAPSRTMGHHETRIYFSQEYMKVALDLLMAFVGPRECTDEQVVTSCDVDMSQPTNLFSVTAHVEKLKCIISDPVMGMHRPILSVCLPSFLLTASQLKEIHGPRSKIDKLTGRDALQGAEDLQASIEATIFIDYFKLGLTRNWEPFVEPFKCLILFEKSTSRGKGITINADCPLHSNITGALIETLDDAIKTFDLFRSDEEITSDSTRTIIPPLSTKYSLLDSGTMKSVTPDEQGHHLTVLHRSAERLEENERIAFSLKNCAGGQIRVHAQSDLETDISSSQTTIAYLDHMHLMPLSFPATETVIRNLQSVEIPFKGDQNAAAHHKKRSSTATSHEVDLQLPGFHWVRNISFDKAGKNFIELVPRSLSVQAKISEDWRLKNALTVLTEINSVNGGRRLTILSPFEVVNKTNHPIYLALNPDPRHSPHYPFDLTKDSHEELGEESSASSTDDSSFAIDRINPDQVHSIPYLLLESALRLKGNHLGSIWIRPDQAFNDHLKEDSAIPNSPGLSTIGYPSRPIQLAKIVHESSVIFKDSNGDPSIANQIESGIEVSCPIFDSSKSRTSRPFCYVLEVKRSPLVQSTQAETVKAEAASVGDSLSPTRMGKGLKAKTIFSKNQAQEKAEIHAPVAYSLVIHAPIIIENLLPEKGRFEIMDATSRDVLWWGSLEAGERVPVHSVGLDAPLLLLVNIGFCRTAVGEGALIHQGGGDGLFKAGWNAIGSAMKTSKDRVRRTLYTITESKDDRGAKRVGMIQTGNVKRKDHKGKKPGQQLKLGFDTENDMIESSHGGGGGGGGGALRRGDGLGAEDIASEVTVIDSLGQRLQLHINNVLGGGGHRHVSLYSPFWIVNTTEHSLRYKQEKSLSYVSGTVLSPEKDGSKPVDGSNRNDAEEEDEEGLVSETSIDSLNTIFSGRPGALSLLNELDDHASKPALLAALISEALPLRIISKLAFMFNFQDVLSLGGSVERLCIQLADTSSDKPRYTSAWSSGFGLESVGVTQIVGMHCKDGRGLEVSVSISVAPGRLSNYTKIVRICPRYVVVNQLPRPVRLWQDNSILHPNLAVEHSRKDEGESQKWTFSSQARPDGVINQYELLFGSPTVIVRDEARGMNAQTTAHHDACYIATVGQSELVAFHLPDTRLERLLRVDFGPSWYLSPSFAADITGECVLSMSHARDLRMLPHVSSRGAPFYTVTLPPTNNDWGGELGVWFETDWGRDRTLIVKGIREGSYASYFTDIIVGDELMTIDDVPVHQLTFDEAMKYLKVRLAAAQEAMVSGSTRSTVRPLQLISRGSKTKRRIPRSSSHGCDDLPCDDEVTLTFRTLEERLRCLRRAAVSKNDTRTSPETLINKDMSQEIDHSNSQGESSKDLLVDMKFLFQSVFIFLREPDPKDPPHRVINRSLHWVIYYRQRACDSHPWKCLSPGESAAYTWEEPMKQKYLSVRVGMGDKRVEGDLSKRHSLTMETAAKGSDKGRRPLFSFHFIENEEQGHFGSTRTVKLEEIGFLDKLPCPARGARGHGSSNDKQESSLCCQVDTEGATRVLIISDEVSMTHGDEFDEFLVRRNLATIKKELLQTEKKRERIHRMKEFPPDMVVSEIDDLGADLDEGLHITKCNQVVVEVLEATGLRSSNLNGLSNPYVKVGLSGNKKSSIGSFRSKATRSTYYVEKTLSPQWFDQSFVFDVPSKASSDPSETRRFSLQCVIKSSERLGKDKFLGQAHVHLRNLKDQREHVGWYPLMGKLGQMDTGKDPLDRVCGSIRLRVQWIHDYCGLMDYYLLCTDRRLETLHNSKQGMKRQLKALQDAAKQDKENSDSFSLRVPALAAMKGKRQQKSFGPDSDGKATTTDDKSKPDRIRDQPSRVIKKSFSAARHIVTKRQSVIKVKKRNEKRQALLSSMESILDDSDESGSSSNEKSDDAVSVDLSGSEELLIYDSKKQARSARSNGNSSSDKADPTESTLFSSDKYASAPTLKSLDPHTSDARILRLRWKIWKHQATNTPPFYLSWNASHAFINGDAEKPQCPKKVSLRLPIAPHEAPAEHAGVALMAKFLKLPPAAPHLVAQREKNHVCELMRSRNSFAKAARRSLGSVNNPGGVLTIRPITALNLPESYTGMCVKLRYGNRICLSETVDSKVAPVWTNEESLYLAHAERAPTSTVTSRGTVFAQRQSSYRAGRITDFSDIAEAVNPARAWFRPRENDLNVQVEAFETSKSLRLTVIGERLQSRVEIGVLEIPLGPALECCAQSMEDHEEDWSRLHQKGLPPAYVRWFPLMSPSEAVPIEGDMGKSARPLESEKLHDNMFAEYFAPCIKLALMFRPNEVDGDSGSRPDSKSSTDQYMYARLDRISAALIDSSRIMELLSFSSRDTDLRISVTTAKTRLAVAVGNIQVDQQSLGTNAKVPVILAPTPVKLPQPTVQFLAWKDNIRSKPTMDSWEVVALEVQEMDLKIEESWLYDVWKFFQDVMKKRDARANLWDQGNKDKLTTTIFEAEQIDNALEKASLFLQEDTKSKKKKIYIRELILGFMKINLSYFKSSKSSYSSDDMSRDVDRLELLFPSPTLPSGQPGQQSADAYYRQWAENMEGNVDERSHINIIGAVFPSISDAPIKFQDRSIEHVFESEGDIWRSLKSFYSSEALRQLYKIVGSLDIVGNPTMVLTSFRTGLRDFVMQPTRELKNITKNPSRVGVGVLKGTLSLVSNSASGIFGFLSNVGATVGHTATMLTLDEHFQRLHSEQKAAQQRHYDRWKKKGFGHVTLMISRPAHDIVFGVISASTGLVTEPYRGAKNDGIIGFTKGTAIGVIGVVVKPIVGLSDAFSHLTESVHDIAKSVNFMDAQFKPVEKFRLPYVFGSRRMLLPFSQVDSRSAQLLLSHPLFKRARKGEEVIVASEALHVGNGVEQYVVVTTMRVALFRLKVVDGQGFITVNLVWQVRFKQGTMVTSSLGNRGHNVSVLYVSRYSSEKGRDLEEANNLGESLHGISILPEESSRFINEDRQSSDCFIEGIEERYSNPETPRSSSFYPLGPPPSSAFKLRPTWPFSAAETEEQVTRFAVEGSFLQRSQLSRIHNAICCLSGDFDSILYERNHYHDRSEGVTSFGSLIFERPHQTPDMPAGLSSLYSSLERTTWKFEGMRHDETPLFYDVLNYSSLWGGPSWLVESRARGMFVPPPAPKLPVLTRNSTHDKVVSLVLSELERGIRTPESAKQDIYRHARELNFQKIKQEMAGNEQFVRHSDFGDFGADNDFDDTEVHSVGSSFVKSFGSLTAENEQDNSVSEGLYADGASSPVMTEDSHRPSHAVSEDLNRERFFTVETPLDENLPVIDESQPVNPPQPPNEVGYRRGLDERLQRVEAMVEALVTTQSLPARISHVGGSDSVQSANMSPVGRSDSSAPMILGDHSHINEARSFDLLSDTPPASHQSQGGNEEVVEALRKEIDDLKKQLADKNDVATTINDLSLQPIEEPSPDDTSEPKSRNKFRSRIKNVFRGK